MTIFKRAHIISLLSASLALYLLFFYLPIMIADSAVQAQQVNSDESFRTNSYQTGPDIDGTNAVWSGLKNSDNYIFVRNLEDDSERILEKIVSPYSSGAQFPRIAGDLVAWNYVDNYGKSRIITRSITTDNRKEVYSTDNSIGDVDMALNKLAWLERPYSGNAQIKLKDLRSNTLRTIATEKMGHDYNLYLGFPKVSRDFTVWKFSAGLWRDGIDRWVDGVQIYNNKSGTKKTIPIQNGQNVNAYGEEVAVSNEHVGLSVNADSLVLNNVQYHGVSAVITYDIATEGLDVIRAVGSSSNRISNITMTDGYIYWREVDYSNYPFVYQVYGYNFDTQEIKILLEKDSILGSMQASGTSLIMSYLSNDPVEDYEIGLVGFDDPYLTTVNTNYLDDSSQTKPSLSDGKIFWLDNRDPANDRGAAIYSRMSDGSPEEELIASKDINLYEGIEAGSGIVAWMSGYDRLNITRTSDGSNKAIGSCSEDCYISGFNLSSSGVIWSERDYFTNEFTINTYDLNTEQTEELISFPDSLGGIYIYDVTDPQLTDEVLVWAVDYYSDDRSNSRLLVKNLDDGTITTIKDEPGSITGVQIDGDNIVWTSTESPNYKIMNYNLDTDQLSTIYSCSNCFEVTADISLGHIVFSDKSYDIRAYDLETKKLYYVTHDEDKQIDPVIDGDLIVWTDYRNDLPDIYGIEIGAATGFR